MRVAIIGNSGSGKSALARRLAAIHRVPVLDLDAVAWEPGEVPQLRDPAAVARDVRSFCSSGARWIIEGCYASLIELALPYQPRLLFLDPGLEVCQANCKSRAWEPHKYRSKKEQDQNLEFLLDWVADYYQRDGDMSFMSHQTLFGSYLGPKQHLVDLPSSDFALEEEP